MAIYNPENLPVLRDNYLPIKTEIKDKHKTSLFKKFKDIIGYGSWDKKILKNNVIKTTTQVLLPLIALGMCYKLSQLEPKHYNPNDFDVNGYITTAEAEVLKRMTPCCCVA
jgi:hypothetical protein